MPRTTVLVTDAPLYLLASDVELGSEEALTLDAKGRIDRFVQDLAAAARALEPVGPWFLRTGHASGKHQYRETCYVEDLTRLLAHVAALVEYSELVDIIGLPSQVWAVREFIRPRAQFHAFRGLPIGRERRYFFRDHQVVCHHPYWPADAIHTASHAAWPGLLQLANTEAAAEVDHLTVLTSQVAQDFAGAWSLDWMQGADEQWYAIDMAPADRSWHPETCPAAGRLSTPELVE